MSLKQNPKKKEMTERLEKYIHFLHNRFFLGNCFSFFVSFFFIIKFKFNVLLLYFFFVVYDKSKLEVLLNQ